MIRAESRASLRCRVPTAVTRVQTCPDYCKSVFASRSGTTSSPQRQVLVALVVRQVYDKTGPGVRFVTEDYNISVSFIHTASHPPIVRSGTFLCAKDPVFKFAVRRFEWMVIIKHDGLLAVLVSTEVPRTNAKTRDDRRDSALPGRCQAAIWTRAVRHSVARLSSCMWKRGLGRIRVCALPRPGSAGPADMQAEKPRTLQMASTEKELETYRLNQKETRRLQEVRSQLEKSEKIQVRSICQESGVVYQDLERLHARELTPSLSEWLQGRVSTKKSAQRKFLARKIDSPKARARKKAAEDAEKRLSELAYTNRMFRASVEQMMGDPAVVDDTSAVETVARHNTFHAEDGLDEAGTDVDTREDSTETREQELDAEAAE
ncbi:hypothetical protein Bbelb_429860 [Branchiostoma belcheri]|nr:hypothetical protein Bbelb_429860 [Branchiostoma belcheri]